MSGNPDRTPTRQGTIHTSRGGDSDSWKSKAEFAQMLDFSRKRLSDILIDSKPLAPEFAVRLAELFGDARNLERNAEPA